MFKTVSCVLCLKIGLLHPCFPPSLANMKLHFLTISVSLHHFKPLPSTFQHYSSKNLSLPPSEANSASPTKKGIGAKAPMSEYTNPLFRIFFTGIIVVCFALQTEHAVISIQRLSPLTSSFLITMQTVSFSAAIRKQPGCFLRLRSPFRLSLPGLPQYESRPRHRHSDPASPAPSVHFAG